jgi:stearoyl-CoA desaturase (Delta-9 desaturase)
MSHKTQNIVILAVTIFMSLFAFVTFSWSNVLLLIVTYSISMMAGGLGFHRYLHGSFKCGPIFRAIMLSLGTTVTGRSPIVWAATHAVHHKYVDTEKDPHSPVRGKMYAFVLWLFDESNVVDPKKVMPHLLKDPVCVWVEKLRWLIVAVALLVPYLIFGFGGLIWGGFLRMLLSGIVISCVNVWGHNDDVPHGEDRGSNNLILALLTFGEGWHKEHHRGDSSCAKYGRKWYQIDMNWYAILLFEKLGLVSNVIRP